MNLPRKLIIQQEVETVEIFTGFEARNKYSINDEHGKRLLYAYEESDAVARQFFSKSRALKMNIIDSSKNPVLTIDRPFKFWLPNKNKETTTIIVVKEVIRVRERVQFKAAFIISGSLALGICIVSSRIRS